MPSAPEPFGDSSAETPAEETARLSRNGVWQEVMRTDAGKRVLSSILRNLGLFSPVVGERMAGKHEAAILLARDLEAVNPVLFAAIMQEAFKDDD